MFSPARSFLRFLRWLFAACVLVALGLMGWGSKLLIAPDPMPAHVDAAFVLQGSIVAEKARLAGAMDLINRGLAGRILLSLPQESYWGQAMPPVARAYLQRTYGNDLAARVDFCETGAEVNSTAQEVEALMDCVQTHNWRSIAVVTSDYHTRRARILCKRTLKRHNSQINLFMVGVEDPEFQAPWWRHRQAAKIWLTESVKLIWTIMGG